MSDLKITFYSTSPPEYSKSKYPKQNKKSYRMPSTASANITVPTHVREEDAVVTYRSLPRENRETEANEKNESPKNTPEKKQSRSRSRSTSTSTHIPTRSHSTRNRNAPSRYEPVEIVIDDYKAEEYDDSASDSSSD